MEEQPPRLWDRVDAVAGQKVQRVGKNGGVTSRFEFLHLLR